MQNALWWIASFSVGLVACKSNAGEDGDGGSETASGTEAPPQDRSFGISFDDGCSIDASALRLTVEATGEDVTPNWSFCAMGSWSWNEYDGKLTVVLGTPGNSGSLGAPGPRWLRVDTSYQGGDLGTVTTPETLPIVEFRYATYTPAEAVLVYVDTDDQQEADTIDFGTLQGVAWARSEGQISVETIDGTVTERNEGFMADAGSVSAELDLTGARVLVDGPTPDEYQWAVFDGALSFSGSKAGGGSTDDGIADGGSGDGTPPDAGDCSTWIAMQSSYECVADICIQSGTDGTPESFDFVSNVYHYPGRQQTSGPAIPPIDRSFTWSCSPGATWTNSSNGIEVTYHVIDIAFDVPWEYGSDTTMAWLVYETTGMDASSVPYLYRGGLPAGAKYD